MTKSCARFQPVKPGSEEHNRRLKRLDYVRDELTKNNQSWSSQSVADRLATIKQLVKDKTGRSLQSKATPIREAVVLIKPTTSMADLQRLKAAYLEHFGIEVFQIDIHKDEGHFNKQGKWVGNYHAHLTADWMDHGTGKSLKLGRQAMSDLQTVTAQVLGMERGVSSDKKHLTALQFKVEQYRHQVEELQHQSEELRAAVSSLNVSKAVKERLLGFLGKSSKDEELKRLKALNEALKAQNAETEKAAARETQNILVEVGKLLGVMKSTAGKPMTFEDISKAITSLQSSETLFRQGMKKAQAEVRELKEMLHPEEAKIIQVRR